MKYNTIANVYDLGPYINKIILKLEENQIGGPIDSETFQVHVVRKNRETKETVQIPKSWGSIETFPSEGNRKVVNAYVSDITGTSCERGSFITLEMEVDPRISLGSTIAFNGKFNVRVDSEYIITQVKPIRYNNENLMNMVFDVKEDEITLLSDEFITDKFEYEGIKLTYASYEPIENGTKRPLLIWLHGAGEGGTDPIIAVSGNKVVNLISKEIQNYFHGSYVLGPQTPTMWMDDGTGTYTTDGSSMYVKALKKMIDEYIIKHTDIDTNRIYIGGCSNGGFMTMKMIITYPHMFAAAYPICEALGDCFITDNDIECIKNIPIWFTHAINDPIVKIELHPDATYQRLLKKGARNVHYTRYQSVRDSSGKYYNEDGTPYEYNGHFSWIPALNNECRLDYNQQPVIINGKEVSLFEWISQQSK